MGAPLVLTKVIELPILRERLWDLLSDTDRLNRSLGLAAVTYESLAASDGRTERFASMPMAAMTLRWKELPFEWVRPEGFHVRRLFADGPLREMILGCDFAEISGGTRLTIRGVFDHRHVLGRWLAALAGRKAIRDMERVARHVTAAAVEETAPYPHRMRRGAVRADILESRRSRLAAHIPADLLANLTRHLEEAADEDVIRMRPFVLADQWAAPRLDVLGACLAATRAEMLELFWVPICPHCRGGREEFRGLSEVKDQAYCASCRQDFNIDFDERLEVRFTVHPEIRAVTDAVYCIGGPGNTPHVLAQQTIGPQEEKTIRLVLEAGAYRIAALPSSFELILLPGAGSSVSEARDSAGATELRVEVGGDVEAGLERLFTPGDVTLVMVNGGKNEVVVSVSSESWDPRAATAALVTSLAEFRDQFAADVLSPGCELAVRSLAVLFSDVKSSTALYDRIGDAPAYAGVREHFSFMAERIAARRGAIVKTMGDAVMAVFASGADALNACMDIQRDVAAFNAREAARLGGHALVLKLGVHRGPLIAVNSNDRLDYFGRTVNIAARAQQLSDGGDIVATGELFDAADGWAMADELGAVVESFTAEVKGIAKPIELRRLRNVSSPGVADGRR